MANWIPPPKRSLSNSVASERILAQVLKRSGVTRISRLEEVEEVDLANEGSVEGRDSREKALDRGELTAIKFDVLQESTG